MRMAPSRRMVSALSMTLAMMCRSSAAYSSGWPSRLGNGTWAASVTRGRLQGGGDLVGAGDVGRREGRSGAEGLGDVGAGRGGAIEQRHPRAPRDQLGGGGPAEAGCAAGDDGLDGAELHGALLLT